MTDAMPAALATALRELPPGSLVEIEGAWVRLPEAVRLAEPAEDQNPAALRARKQRQCLKCGCAFMSEGSHNHLCSPCGAVNAGSAAGEYGLCSHR